MTLLDAALLGVVEGITEFLPISSTAHLMVTSEVLGLAQSAFVKSFEISIQLGAILAVVALYWRMFLQTETLKKVLVAFVPTALMGLALYPLIKTYLIGNVPLALGALAVGGALLIVFERFAKNNSSHTSMSYTQALLVGLAQSVAVVPGVSRSAATIVGGLLLGINRQTIVEFSFLLAVPTMAAATGLDLVTSYQSFSSSDFMALSVGFVVSFVVAMASIQWLLRFVKTHDFTSFGIYRILAAALFFFILF